MADALFFAGFLISHTHTSVQIVRIQETPESIPAGETPHTVEVFVFEQLLDIARPGDRVEITGIFRGVSRFH